MKIIINESQINSINLETKSEIMYKLMLRLFPNNEMFESPFDTFRVVDDADNYELLFEFRPETNELFFLMNYLN